MHTLLVATDGSESSERALAFAIELAQTTGAALEVVSVRTLDGDDTSQHIAERAAVRARRAGVASTPHAREGDTVSCIVDTAAQVRAELLVIGSRGLGARSGAALGSVSQALVRRSPVPITIVRHAHSPGSDRT